MFAKMFAACLVVLMLQPFAASAATRDPGSRLSGTREAAVLHTGHDQWPLSSLLDFAAPHALPVVRVSSRLKIFIASPSASGRAAMLDRAAQHLSTVTTTTARRSVSLTPLRI